MKISEFVKLLKDHLGKFNYKFPLPWAAFIKKLYQIYIYDDPFIQNSLSPFIGQVKELIVFSYFNLFIMSNRC